MELEKAIIELNLLHNRIKDSRKAAMFGIDASDSEVANLWIEYNELRTIFIRINPELFKDLRELQQPISEEAHPMSHHPFGTMVFTPKHFGSLENEIDKAMKYIVLVQNETRQYDKNRNISINAGENALVNVTLGNNNNIHQNGGHIENIYNELEKLGVDKSDIESLREIILQQSPSKENKIGVGKKILSWVGGLSSKLIEKGLSENFPVIIEKAQSLTDLL